MAYDEEHSSMAEAIAEIETKFGVKIEVLEEVGPGGGWPEIKLVGEREALVRALKEGWGYDDSDLADEQLALIEA